MATYHNLSARNQTTIRRILKVNHAGEYGAIRIYRAQLWIARRWYPDIVDFLEETLDHEIKHCQRFTSAMTTRDARSCRVMPLWGNGGFILGFITALLGRQSIWICTSAVEATVHRHLVDQLSFLEGKDEELTALIMEIQFEELDHLHYAKSQISRHNLWSGILTSGISTVTDILIWLSTWGDSTRMMRDFKTLEEK